MSNRAQEATYRIQKVRRRQPVPDGLKSEPGGGEAVLTRSLIAIGTLGGLLSGLLGVGGGVIMVPLLVLWAGFSQRRAHATSLGAIIPISIAGVITFGAAGQVDLKAAALLAIGSIVGARTGAGILARADDRKLKLVFGVFLLVAAVLMITDAP